MTEDTSSAARARRGRDKPADASADSHPSGDDRFAVIDKHLKRGRYAQDQLIETLHIAQDVFGYLDDGILIYVARALRLPPSMVYGVATFYQLFTFDPPGEHTCTVCTGTACFVKGANDIVAAVPLPTTFRPARPPRTACSPSRRPAASARAGWRRWCCSTVRSKHAKAST